MEGFTMNFKGKIGTFIVNKLLEKFIGSRLGYKVNIDMDELSIHRSSGAILTINKLTITCDESTANQIVNDITRG